MSEDALDVKISFKVKTSSDSNHTIEIAETASVLDLKNLLAGTDYENIPSDRQRLIYSGRVMKNEEPLSVYKIKNGNTIHMVKSAQSNAAQNPAVPGTTTARSGGAATGVPTNMAAGTANNPLAGLTGARYAGHVQLPGRDMFGPDGGMGPPPSEDDMVEALSNPATAQMVNEALQNPQMIEMMIQSNPQLRAMGPQARQMLQSPMFRQMLTDPNMLRQAAQMRRAMGGDGGASAFPAPGLTDTTPEGAAGSAPAAGQANAQNPFGSLFGAPAGVAGGANPFASLFGPPGGLGGGFPFAAPTGTTPATSPPPPASAGQGTPSATAGAGTPATEGAGATANPFAALFPGMTPGTSGTGVASGGMSSNPFNMTPEQLQQMQQMAQQMGLGDMMGGGLGGGFGGFGAPGGAGSPAPPADTRPPEEMYADQLRQLNDMGFFDFDANVQALRRSGGSVTGAVNSLLGG